MTKKHTERKRENSVPLQASTETPASEAPYTNGKAHPESPWAGLGLDPEALAGEEISGTADPKRFTEADMENVVQRAFRLGAQWGVRRQHRADAMVVHRLEKRLRRIKHALHAVSAESLQD